MKNKVLLLGDPLLRKKSLDIKFPLSDRIRQQNEKLMTTLGEFQREKGFGRAIAAPQIGINRKIIALNLSGETFSIFNPEIIRHSEETFLLWDDCMSFPDLLVKVQRYTSVCIKYRDIYGNEQTWENMDRSQSELLQHEIDHLHGIMAIDRAVDKDSIIYKSVFHKNKAQFLKNME